MNEAVFVWEIKRASNVFLNVKGDSISEQVAEGWVGILQHRFCSLRCLQPYVLWFQHKSLHLVEGSHLQVWCRRSPRCALCFQPCSLFPVVEESPLWIFCDLAGFESNAAKHLCPFKAHNKLSYLCFYCFSGVPVFCCTLLDRIPRCRGWQGRDRFSRTLLWHTVRLSPKIWYWNRYN